MAESKKRLAHMNPVVFFVSAAVVLLFVVLGAVWPEQMKTAFETVQSFIVEKLGWFYILAVTFFLVFVLWLLVSPYGQIKLGKDDDEPEYSNASWFAMLFSAGMGIGLLFFSVAEPVMHFTDPPRGEAGTIVAAQQAMNITFFHWGLHAWAIYIVVGLALAYFAYRHDLPLTIRSTLYPVLGSASTGASAMRWRSWRSSGRSSAWPRRWGWACSRSMRGWTTSGFSVPRRPIN